MVREGEKPSLVEAVCCKVEVVKGGRGTRFVSVSLRSVIAHLESSPTCLMRSASAFSLGSTEQKNGISIPLALV